MTLVPSSGSARVRAVLSVTCRVFGCWIGQTTSSDTNNFGTTVREWLKWEFINVDPGAAAGLLLKVEVASYAIQNIMISQYDLFNILSNTLGEFLSPFILFSSVAAKSDRNRNIWPELASNHHFEFFQWRDNDLSQSLRVLIKNIILNFLMRVTEETSAAGPVHFLMRVHC